MSTVAVPPVAWPFDGITPQQFATALADAGFDLPALIGSVWRNRYTVFGDDFAHVTSAGNTVLGWQVRVDRYDGATGTVTGSGVLHLAQLVDDFEHVQDGEHR